mgnify:FL=1
MEPDVKFAPRNELLTVPELVRVASVCVGLGVDKVRLTGGEPTLHPSLTHIIRGVAALGVPDVALTTNGSRMDAAVLDEWKQAGLSRITISIDSLDEGRFAAVTRSTTRAADVAEAVRAAKRAGFSPVKINAVAMRGVNETDLPELAALARDLDIEARFIEFMPLDSGRAWDPGKLMPADEIIARIGARFPLVPLGRDEPSSTSLTFTFADGSPGRIGIIAPVTRPFCGACSRLRITADGKVRPCLFSLREWDLRPLLRGGAGDREIGDYLIDATWTKQAGHGITAPGFEQPQRPMSSIGG